MELSKIANSYTIIKQKKIIEGNSESFENKYGTKKEKFNGE